MKVTELHSLRNEIGGISFPQDRLWQITTPDFIAGLTEYNDEITGVTPTLQWVWETQGTFYWFKQECEKRGWKIDHIEDRV